MAKTKISEFSTTAGNNTDINSINIAEGCAPSGINDAIRELMRQLKEFQTGGAGDSVNSGGDFSVATNKFTVASASGNTAVAGTLGVTGAATLSSTLAVTGTTTLTGALVANGNATLGDGSGDTVTVKGTPTLEVNPTLSGGTANGVLYLNGSKVATSGSALTFDGTTFKVSKAGSLGILAENTANTSAAYVQVTNTAGSTYLGQDSVGGYVGTGYSAPFLFYINNTEAMRLTSTSLYTASGINVGIGTSSPGYKLDVIGSARIQPASGYNFLFQNSGTTARINYLNDAFSANVSAAYRATDFAWQKGDGSEVLKLDSSGNLGLGVTPSAWSGPRAFQFGAAGAVYASSNDNYFASNAYFDGTNFKRIAAAASGVFGYDGTWKWLIAGSSTADSTITFTQAMTLDASGNLGIGTTSPTQRLEVRTAADKITQFLSGSGAAVQWQTLNDAKTANVPLAISTSETYFLTGGSERARIDSSGNLLVGTELSGNAFAVYKLNNDVINSYTGQAAGTGRSLYTGWYGATSSTQGTLSFNVTSNGNVTNTNNSYGAISDIKLKENVVDATPKLEKLCQVRVVNYNFKEGQTHKQIGVIAQELEQVFPSMVEEVPDRDSEGNDIGTTTKQVKYSVFVPMLIKAIQEQQALIQQLTARVAQLESN